MSARWSGLVLMGVLFAPQAAEAGETDTPPAGVFVFDESYLDSHLDSRWNDQRQASSMIAPTPFYQPGGGLLGTVTAQPQVYYQLAISQIDYGISDNWTAVVVVPLVLKTTIQTHLGWTPGAYQPELGRSYSEADFWAWAASMGQPEPTSQWTRNRATFADMIVGTRYRIPRNSLFDTLGIRMAGTLLIALPTGHAPDPEQLVASGTNAWELHSYGDVEGHVGLDRALFVDHNVARLSLGFEGYYAWMRPRSYTTPTGSEDPLMLDYQPYVGNSYTIHPGNWEAGQAELEGVPFIGPTRASAVSGGDLAVADSFPGLVTLSASYTYVHCEASTWSSDSAIWDYQKEQLWAEGDKSILKGSVVVSLLRLGLPLQLYADYHNQSWLPGKNSPATDSWDAGIRLIARFWGG